VDEYVHIVDSRSTKWTNDFRAVFIGCELSVLPSCVFRKAFLRLPSRLLRFSARIDWGGTSKMVDVSSGTTNDSTLWTMTPQWGQICPQCGQISPHYGTPDIAENSIPLIAETLSISLNMDIAALQN
jgi:hypothetical protein